MAGVWGFPPIICSPPFLARPVLSLSKGRGDRGDGRKDCVAAYEFVPNAGQTC